MSILVNHCYHWIGFHLVNTLLEQGYSVIGVNDKENMLNDHLKMFLGRNSSFREWTEKEQKTDFLAVFMFSANPKFKHIKTKRWFKIGKAEKNAKTSVSSNKVFIHPPLLFGEWMPMTEKGMFYENQLIEFDSSYFLENAVLIRDFSRLLTKWVESTHLSTVINMYSSNIPRNEGEKLENSVYIHDNIPINEKLENVISHYEKFNMLYEQ